MRRDPDGSVRPPQVRSPVRHTSRLASGGKVDRQLHTRAATAFVSTVVEQRPDIVQRIEEVAASSLPSMASSCGDPGDLVHAAWAPGSHVGVSSRPTRNVRAPTAVTASRARSASTPAAFRWTWRRRYRGVEVKLSTPRRRRRARFAWHPRPASWRLPWPDLQDLFEPSDVLGHPFLAAIRPRFPSYRRRQQAAAASGLLDCRRRRGAGGFSDQPSSLIAGSAAPVLQATSGLIAASWLGVSVADVGTGGPPFAAVPPMRNRLLPAWC